MTLDASFGKNAPVISEVYAMAPTPNSGQPAQGMGSSFLIPMVVIFGIFYFLIIRPQKKKELQIRKLLSDLKKGDEVITQSGIYGRVAGVTDQVVTLEIATNVKIRVSKSAIVGFQPKANETAAA